jgi:ABC-type transport system involved in multi-copper enzyme maturation permease subunit
LKFWSIILLTFRESLAKKTFIGFLAISTFVMLLFIFALNLDIVDGAQTAVSVFGLEIRGLEQIENIVVNIQSVLTVLIFLGGIFISLFATSNLIPTLLQPGFIDLFISKPVSRLEIISGRFLGSVSIVAFNLFYLIFGLWLILSLKTGLWNTGFLLSGLMILITFTILYSLMTFLGLITGSGPFALMITYMVLFFSPLLLQRDQIYALLSAPVYGYLIDGLYYILPKTAELGDITQKLAGSVTVPDWMPLWSSLIFALCMFFISSFLFYRKNF